MKIIAINIKYSSRSGFNLLYAIFFCAFTVLIEMSNSSAISKFAKPLRLILIILAHLFGSVLMAFSIIIEVSVITISLKKKCSDSIFSKFMVARKSVYL